MLLSTNLLSYHQSQDTDRLQQMGHQPAPVSTHQFLIMATFSVQGSLLRDKDQ